MAKFARNNWYVAAWLSELDDGPIARRILDVPVVLFRDSDGTAAALLDRCPHRLVPLSMGTVTEKGLQCGYHGMVFNGAGQCMHIPGQAKIPPQARVDTFPVVERFGIAWIWMGDAALADPAGLPDIPHHGDSDWALIDGGYQHHPSNYLNIVENLMDPSHTTFVHKQTIGNPQAADVPVTMERSDKHIVAYKWVENSNPTPVDQKIKDFGDQKVDRGIYFYMFLPSMSRVDIITIPAGLERTEANFDGGLRNNSYKFLTPETEGSTHFFWLHLRNYRVGDTGFSDQLRAMFEVTFLEDRDIEMAMQRWQEEVGVRQFVGLEIDRAPTVALRMIGNMVSEEQRLQTYSG